MKNPKVSLAFCAVALIAAFMTAFPLELRASVVLPEAPCEGVISVDFPSRPAEGEKNGTSRSRNASLPAPRAGDADSVPRAGDADPAPDAVRSPLDATGAPSAEGRSAAEMTVAIVVTLLVAGAVVFGIVAMKPES